MILVPPPIQHHPGFSHVPMVSVYSEYLQRSDVWKKYEDELRAVNIPPATFWTRELQFKQLVQVAQKAKVYEVGWDGYDAPAPNENAVEAAIKILASIKSTDLNPFSVLPSADGGIGITFRGTNNRRAVLEILNDGTAAYMLYGKGYPLESSPFDANSELTPVFKRVLEYL